MLELLLTFFTAMLTREFSAEKSELNDCKLYLILQIAIGVLRIKYVIEIMNNILVDLMYFLKRRSFCGCGKLTIADMSLDDFFFPLLINRKRLARRPIKIDGLLAVADSLILRETMLER
jgi:hypothetical protein